MKDMKKFLFFSLLTAFMITCFSVDADAQYRRKKKKKKKKPSTEKKSDYFDDSGFVHKLWYGADVVIGVGGSNQATQISTGISPMVGYKFTDNFSLGPKISLNNYHVKFANGAQDDIKLNNLNYGAGIFTRYKILGNYFIHAELEGINEEIVEDFDRIQIDPATNKIITVRDWNTHYYLGAGYTSGGNLSFNAYILWDFSEQLTSTNIPIDSRIGITYKF